MNPPVLIVLTGKHKGKRVKLTDTETLVGRDEEARLRIASHEVSRQHGVGHHEPSHAQSANCTDRRQRMDTIISRCEATFPGGCRILITNIYDPSDGSGDIEMAGLPAWPDGLQVLSAWNQLVDSNHPAFVYGHLSLTGPLHLNGSW